jgi:hypothetical protein
MTPTPFTRDTLMQIRREAWRGPAAVASLLNWSVDRTERVARSHGISFDAARPEQPPETISPPLVPQADRLSASAGKPAYRDDDADWTPATELDRSQIAIDEANRRIVCGGRTMEFGAKQWFIFLAIFRCGGAVIGSALANRAGINPRTLSSHTCAINRKLEGTIFAIRGSRGHNGGYRLMRRVDGV